MLLTAEELITRNLCGTYISPCFCAFLIHLFERLLLSSIPCRSSGIKWMTLLPFAVVELLLCLSRSELQGYGLSFRKLCFLQSQYLLEDDKSILPTGCKWCGSHTVWNALGNWSQSCLGLWKEARSCQWGTSEEKKDRLSHSLWSVSLGRWAAVIWNSSKCDLNAAEFWLQLQSLSGFSLQSYIKARWGEAGKKSMDNNECRNSGLNLSWQLLYIPWDILSPVFRLLYRHSIKIYTEKRVILLLVKILFWKNVVLFLVPNVHMLCITYMMFAVPLTAWLKALAAQSNSVLM